MGLFYLIVALFLLWFVCAAVWQTLRWTIWAVDWACSPDDRRPLSPRAKDRAKPAKVRTCRCSGTSGPGSFCKKCGHPYKYAVAPNDRTPAQRAVDWRAERNLNELDVFAKGHWLMVPIWIDGRWDHLACDPRDAQAALNGENVIFENEGIMYQWNGRFLQAVVPDRLPNYV